MARDPQGKQALFGPPTSSNGARPADGPEAAGGKEALFSAPGRRPGPVSVRCGGCGGTSPVGWLELAWRRLPLPLWAPWRRHPFLMMCPACEQRRWVSLRWRR